MAPTMPEYDWMKWFIEGNTSRSLIQAFRDLTCVRIHSQHQLVIATDSVGGIGMKAADAVRVLPEVVGYFALRVPLMEILAIGATPFLVVNTQCQTSDEYSDAILHGMKMLAQEVGMEERLQFNGSTEDNVPTIQTGVGVTVVGIVSDEKFYGGTIRAGQIALVAGLPKSAPTHEIQVDDQEILSIRDLQTLRSHPQVSDILPVGSKGILYEANQLASTSGLSFQLEDSPISFTSSAGPSTCVVFACDEWGAIDVMRQITAPVTRIGTFIALDAKEE